MGKLRIKFLLIFWPPVCISLGLAGALDAQEYKSNLSPEHPAIRYATGSVRDRVARLMQDEARRGAESMGTRPLDQLSDLLTRLQVNIDSQMLVFSKTSVQASHVSPDRPRAIYFGDDVAVAYVPTASNVEIAALDPVYGPVFYTMSLDGNGTIARGTSCLQCHHGPNTAGVPGLYVGSVIPGPTGIPFQGESAVITDHRSDFKDRWGGWYVTARRGEQPDRANAVAASPAEPETLMRESRQNLPDLIGRFNPEGYPTLTSDIVALMTFEHQTQMTNLVTRVGWAARMATHDGTLDTAGTTALSTEIEDVVSYMLFVGEAPITDPIEGVSTFTQSFPKRGPHDRRGRSLRDFDLRTRMFRYPLSYMIYSETFDALPDVVRSRIYARLFEVLSGTDRSARYGHLSADDRRAILEILLETKRDLPASWRANQ